MAIATVMTMITIMDMTMDTTTGMGTPTNRVGTGGPPVRAAAKGIAGTDGRAARPHLQDNLRWVAGLLQMSDSFYPTGAYAHSFGLEGLAQEGVVTDRATLRAFLLDEALPQLGRTDLPIAARAWAAAGDPPDWPRLREACFLGSAVRGAREPREASETIGRQRLELLAKLHGGLGAALSRRAAAEGWPRPACVAAAIEGRTLGAPAEAVLAALVYAALASLAAAAVKLLRLGQNAVQTLLAEGLTRAPDLIAAALALETADIGAFNPWWDIAAARHESADGRLFIS